MTDGKKRTLKEWLEEKNMTPEQLMRAGARISTDVIQCWVRTGKMPLEAEKNGLHVADALGIPPEHLDLGPNRRGMSEGAYRFVLYTYGTDGTGWEAYIDAWGSPKERETVTPHVLAHRFNDSSIRIPGSTAEAALNGLEAELRMLIRAYPRR